MNDIQIFNNPESSYDLKSNFRWVKGMNDYLGYFYVLEYGSYVKIGSTKSPYDRYMQLSKIGKSYADVEIGRFAVSRFAHTNYHENEKLLHNRFKQNRKSGTELFDISFEECLTTIDELRLSFDCDSEDKKREAEAFINGVKRLVMGEFNNQIRNGEKIRLMESVDSVKSSSLLTNGVTKEDYFRAAEILSRCGAESRPQVTAMLAKAGVIVDE